MTPTTPQTTPGIEWEQTAYRDYPADVQRALYQQRSFVRAALAAIDKRTIKLIDLTLLDQGITRKAGT